MFKILLSVFLLNVLVSTVLGYCSAEDSSIALFEEVQDLPNHPEKFLIDVRTPEEVKETGGIPTSIHIPLASVREALSLKDEKQFVAKYGPRFPKPEDELIFYCLRGKRAQEAMEIACSLGYNKSRFYKGSWQEWAEKNGLKTGNPPTKIEAAN